MVSFWVFFYLIKMHVCVLFISFPLLHGEKGEELLGALYTKE